MIQITNINAYISGMQKSIVDKLFFMNKVDDYISTIIDYGCADGTLIKEMNKVKPDLHYIGYDNNVDMINIAKKNTFNDQNVNFTNNFNFDRCSNDLLNLSSVIHEVYSYCSCDEIKKFWDNVFSHDFKYISIRDFCVSKSINRTTDINDYTKLIQTADKNQINDFESIWGSLRDNRNFIHFLMKYRYKANWDREVRENYFPITLEQLLSKIPTDKYEIIYFEDYCLPFTRDTIKKNFDINIVDKTHVKLLLKRKSRL